MERDLLLVGDRPRDFWNRLFTVVFSGEAEACVSDPETCYLLGQHKVLCRVTGSQETHGGGLVCAQRLSGPLALQSIVLVDSEYTLYFLPLSPDP